jgi:hypothetical protein
MITYWRRTPGRKYFFYVKALNPDPGRVKKNFPEDRREGPRGDFPEFQEIITLCGRDVP